MDKGLELCGMKSRGVRYWTHHRGKGKVKFQGMQTGRAARENVPLPVDTTGGTLPNSRLLTVEGGEVSMESV